MTTNHFVKTLMAQEGSPEHELLSFRAGDLIEVACIADIGWWRGTVLRTGAVGYFDQTNVEIVDDTEAALIMEQLKLQQQLQQQDQMSKHERRKSLRSILAAIDTELVLLRDACEMQVGTAAANRPKSFPARLDPPPRPLEPLPPLPNHVGKQLQQVASAPPALPAAAPAPLTPLPPVPPPKSLKPKLSLTMAGSSEEPPPVQEPDSPLIMTRAKRSVTFSENLVTVIQEHRIQERKDYLAQKKRELTETLRGLEAEGEKEALKSSEERQNKAALFLCEERILPTMQEEEEFEGLKAGAGKGQEKKKRTVWTWMNKRKEVAPEPKPFLMMSH